MTDSKLPPCNENILIVDDLVENLHLLQEILTHIGYKVSCVTNKKMAMKNLQQTPFDLVLLNINMKKMEGHKVFDAIKANMQLHNIPIIFLTVVDGRFNVIKSFEYGAADFVTLPFHMVEVIARIENQLTLQKQKFASNPKPSKISLADLVLNQSKVLLANVSNSILDGSAVLQAVRDEKKHQIEDFRCIVVNPIVAKVFNRSREELIGNLVFKNFICRISKELFSYFVNIVETGEPLEQDFHYLFGEAAWFHLIAVKLDDGLAIAIRDITARKQLEIQLQEANRKLYLLAHLDGLTQIANRRCFDEILEKEWRRLWRSKKSLSLLMMDVDYFKLYNDGYGHQQGDECLMQVAKALQRSVLRSADLVARYGGEEFAVILPETPQEGAIVIAQTIHQIIQTLAIPHRFSKISDIVTVSIGISCLIPSEDFTVTDLINQADKALYMAKQQGRNCYYLNT